MRKSTIAIGIAAALTTQAFVATTNADAAVKLKSSKASGPNHATPHFKYPNHNRPSGGNVLYDQSGTTENGFPSQNFESIYDAYDAAGADDFVVGDATGWDVSAFNFQVSVGDPSTATYDINVYPDAGGLPGASTVCAYPALAGTVAGGTALSVALPTACHLPPGTYWVSMIANLDVLVGGQLFWSLDSRTGMGAPAAWENPGDGFGTGCTVWTDNSTGCAGSGLQTAEFQVIGAIGSGGGTCDAGDLCLVSTVGTDLSAGACGTADTIDATNGDQLNFCYTITNHTGVELDYHTLENNVDGTLFTLLNQPVPDGGTFQFNHIETVTATNTWTSTWTGQDVPPGYAPEVTGGGGGDCSDRIFGDGFDGTPLPCPGGGGGFIDISSTGTPLGLPDDGSADVTMPFSFTFYGSTSNLLSVSNNGGIIFGASGATLAFTNVSLPAASLLGPAILPLWDDFDSEQGNVYTDIRGTSPNRQFIVEWYQRVHYFGNTDPATFEAIFNEADGTLQFEYLDVEYTGANNSSGDPDVCDGGVCATIGLQNDPTLFNQFSAFEAAVTDNSGIKWTPTSPQVFTGTDTVTVNVGQPTIVVNNNQPITGTVPAGGSNSIQFPIANTGNRDLNWSLTEAGPADLHFPPPGTRYTMPMGDPSSTSARPAPLSLHHPNTKPYHPLTLPTHGTGTVPMFAADIYNNQFVTLDALNPGSLNVVAATDGTAWTGGAFVDGDFSKLYVLSGSFAANPDQFATIDTATGAKTVIGSAPSPGGAGWNGMAYDSTTGTMYAVTGCPSGTSLYKIDINTGTPTLVGAMTNEGCSVTIAIDSAGQMYSIDIVADSLFAVDKTTANDSMIGSIGFDANFAQESTFDLSTDVLYYAAFNNSVGADIMYTVDTSSGATTEIGPIGFASGFGELDAMGIETAGGPCSQPQDLPWLSLSPLTGTTPPAGSTPVTASIDGTGTADGDVLAGTVCATSNDPDNRTVATPINVTVGGTGGGNVVDSGVINLDVTQDITGLYINWLTGAHCDSSIGGCGGSGPYDFSPYDFLGMIFYWGGPLAATSNCVATTSSCDILTTGASIGPSSTFAQGDSTNFAAGNSTGYLGFSFVNANTSQVNYGYALFTTTAGGGFPATLVEYWYDNSGAAITIAP
jgi:hypothetical protein